MPILLDVLTIISIVGSLALLWVNLRGSLRRRATAAPPEQRAVPANAELVPAAVDEEPPVETSYVAAPPTEAFVSRARAEECLDHADRSTSHAEKEAWLRMGVKWIMLAEDEERSSAESDTTDHTKSTRRYS